jgi:hypothetical protein
VVFVLSLVAGSAWGQPRAAVPLAPRAPTAPAAPGAPPSPDAPPGSAGASELTLALLFVGTRTSVPDAVVVRLADALLGLLPAEPAAGRADVTRLATLLCESLRRRDVKPEAGRRVAVELASALTSAAPPVAEAPGAEPGCELDRALARVREALAGAGLGDPDIVLIDAEVRRLSPAGRSRRR